MQRLKGTLSFTVIITEVNANSSFETHICSAFVNHDQHAVAITDSHNVSYDVYISSALIIFFNCNDIQLFFVKSSLYSSACSINISWNTEISP